MPTRDDDTLLAGASGLVGREIARQWTGATGASGAATLHLLLRRAPVEAPPPGRRVHVVDFAALPALPPAGRALCALGTTIAVAGSRPAFRAVDFDAVLAFARAARAAGVGAFGVVSALGADAGSRVFYNRVKGEMEDALRGVGFDSLVIARPSLLLGDRHALGQAPRAGERVAAALTAPLARWLPAAWRPIEAAAVARALLRAVDARTAGVRVLESAALQRLGAR